MPKKHLTKVKKEINSDEPVHIKLDKPLTFRKELLGTTIDVARVLSSSIELKEIREIKENLIQSMGEIYADINRLTKKFESELPNVNFFEDKKNIVEEDILESSHVEKKEPSEIDKLKAELESIEKKLGNF